MLCVFAHKKNRGKSTKERRKYKQPWHDEREKQQASKCISKSSKSQWRWHTIYTSTTMQIHKHTQLTHIHLASSMCREKNNFFILKVCENFPLSLLLARLIIENFPLKQKSMTSSCCSLDMHNFTFLQWLLIIMTMMMIKEKNQFICRLGDNIINTVALTSHHPLYICLVVYSFQYRRGKS